MEAMIPDILVKLGVGGISAAVVYLVLSSKIEALRNSLTKHISHHQDYEKNICHKFDKMYERLNPLCDAVNKILGYIEAQNDKG